MTDLVEENEDCEDRHDPLSRAWLLSVNFLGLTAEMQSRLIAFSPADLQKSADHVVVNNYIKDPLEALRRLHLQQARPDRSRVHPSWFKALESKQISPVRRALRGENHATAGSLRAIVLESAKMLSAERLVGDTDAWIDDPAVIRMFEHERPIGWLRKLAWSGRLRRWVAGEKETFYGLPAYAQLRPSDSWQEMARKSLDQMRVAAKGKPVRASRYALISLAMLGGQVDARRRQWILQHLPMTIGALIAPLLRTEKKTIDENEMCFETWLAEWAVGFEDNSLGEFVKQFQVKEAVSGNENKLIEAETVSPVSFETNDMELMPEIDESYRLIADISDEKIPLPEELFELDESIEIVSMKSDNSGIFDPEIDQLIIEDSSVIEIEINDGHDEMELNEENDSNETEDDSSFRIGDLEL